MVFRSYIIARRDMNTDLKTSCYPKRRVVLDHDGGIDDLVALAILATAPNIDLLGVVCIDADCFIKDAVSVTSKVLSLIDLHRIVPVGVSTLRGNHPFPREWRKDASNMNALPCLNTDQIHDRLSEHDPVCHDLPGEELLYQLVACDRSTGGDGGPVTIVVTGPLTNVAYCIQKFGEAFTQHVEEVVVMGGAVDVSGNVFPQHVTDGHRVDSTQEWNFYWDAEAVQTVLSCPGLRVTLLTLDSTNSVPITTDFVQRFGKQNRYSLSQFVGSSWAMCVHFSDIFGEANGYFAWDVLTATYVIDPTVCLVEPIRLEVETSGPSEGRIWRRGECGLVGSETMLGAQVQYAVKCDADKFYQLVLDRCCAPH